MGPENISSKIMPVFKGEVDDDCPWKSARGSPELIMINMVVGMAGPLQANQIESSVESQIGEINELNEGFEPNNTNIQKIEIRENKIESLEERLENKNPFQKLFSSRGVLQTEEVKSEESVQQIQVEGVENSPVAENKWFLLGVIVFILILIGFVGLIVYLSGKLGDVRSE